jgi:hypothetical protein
MHLIIDGYNLLHAGRSLIKLSPIELQWERDRLIDQLSKYQQTKPWKITVVFDGWEGGWSTENRDKKKGIELIFSKLGEKADDVIKRLVREKGSGAMVVTSDREVSKYAEKMSVAVIPSDQFKNKIARVFVNGSEEDFKQEEEERGMKRKGPSRRLSKKERRIRTALKKL